MTTYLAEISEREMRSRLSDALHVYMTAMAYPAGVEEQRAPTWLEHTQRPGWYAVGAFQTPDGVPLTDLREARMVGVAYGYRGSRDQWWYQQVAMGLREAGVPVQHIVRMMSHYFELTELHIDPSVQGRGLGEALTRRLLEHRPESHVMLSTPEIEGEANRAWRLYRRLGFVDVVRQHQFSGDPRRFAVLSRALPLTATLPATE